MSKDTTYRSSLICLRFGYVEFEDAADAKKAYENMKDTEIDGRTINLDYANPNHLPALTFHFAHLSHTINPLRYIQISYRT